MIKQCLVGTSSTVVATAKTQRAIGPLQSIKALLLIGLTSLTLPAWSAADHVEGVGRIEKQSDSILGISHYRVHITPQSMLYGLNGGVIRDSGLLRDGMTVKYLLQPRDMDGEADLLELRIEANPGALPPPPPQSGPQ